MLKITATDNDNRRILMLEGKLIDPWVAELEKSWDEARSLGSREVLVDLKDVTAISQHGENVLYRMMAEGAKFFCCRGVLTRHVVNQLQRRREPQKEDLP